MRESRKRDAWKAYSNHRKGIRCPLSALSSLRSVPTAFPRNIRSSPSLTVQPLLYFPNVTRMDGAKVGLMASQEMRQLAEKTIPVAKICTWPWNRSAVLLQFTFLPRVLSSPYTELLATLVTLLFQSINVIFLINLICIEKYTERVKRRGGNILGNDSKNLCKEKCIDVHG